MMKKVHSWRFIVHSVLFFLALYATCYAQPISSTELINNARQYHGKLVVYEGEVIGDVMLRGEYAWLNLNDGQNAIGIWLDKDLTKDILYTGSYKSKGDWVEITGIFQRICLAHGGDLDIHGQAVRILSRGRRIEDKLNPAKANQALVLLAVLFFLWILTRLKRK